MPRLIAAAATAVVLALAPAPVSAHDNYRVIGTVTRVEATRLGVKTRDGAAVSIKVDKQTVVWRDKKKVAATALKNGLSVVVDGYGDSEDELLALDVTIVPPLAKATPKK